MRSLGKFALALFAVLAAGACSAPEPLAPQAASATADEAAWPEGIYSSVGMSEMTGDLGGFEVRFFDEGGKRMAEFVLCEGWCNRAYRAEVMREGDEFRFSHVDQVILYTDGEPTPVAGRRIAYNLELAGEGLRYRYSVDGEPMATDPDLSLLLPLEKPFGLAVAKDED